MIKKKPKNRLTTCELYVGLPVIHEYKKAVTHSTAQDTQLTHNYTQITPNLRESYPQGNIKHKLLIYILINLFSKF